MEKPGTQYRVNRSHNNNNMCIAADQAEGNRGDREREREKKKEKERETEKEREGKRGEGIYTGS